jgi:hypothetical protein
MIIEDIPRDFPKEASVLAFVVPTENETPDSGTVNVMVASGGLVCVALYWK